MPSNVTEPVTSALCFGSRPMTASDVTLLPQPEFADQPERAAARERDVDAVDRDRAPPAVAVEHDAQIFDRQQRCGHHFGSAASAAAMPASIFARSNSPDGFFEFGRNFAKCTQRSRLTFSSRSSSGSGSA